MRKSSRIISVRLRLFHKGQLNVAGLRLKEHTSSAKELFAAGAMSHGRCHLEMCKTIIVLKGVVVKMLCSFCCSYWGPPNLPFPMCTVCMPNWIENAASRHTTSKCRWRSRSVSTATWMPWGRTWRHSPTATTPSTPRLWTRWVRCQRFFSSIKHLWQFVNVELELLCKSLFYPSKIVSTSRDCPLFLPARWTYW